MEQRPISGGRFETALSHRPLRKLPTSAIALKTPYLKRNFLSSNFVVVALRDADISILNMMNSGAKNSEKNQRWLWDIYFGLGAEEIMLLKFQLC